MPYYAQISKDSGLCSGITNSGEGLINSENCIIIPEYDLSVIGKKYVNGKFESEYDKLISKNVKLEPVDTETLFKKPGFSFLIINGLQININETSRNLLKMAIGSNKDDINLLTFDKQYVKLSHVELVNIQNKIDEYDASDKTNNIYF